jgi:GNAT superfamily N-acetyltransferase
LPVSRRSGEGGVWTRVRRGSADHSEPCMDIARGLRTHFDDGAMEKMPVDLKEHDLYIAEDDDGQVMGFLTVLRRSADVGDVSWMGVRNDQWRRGIGTALLEKAAADLTSDGTSILMVHTLSDIVEYEPYETTRAFYDAMGFKHLETIDPYPGVAPGNPIAIYVKPLQ